MATATTHAPAPNGARRVERPPVDSPRRFHLAAACYAGIVLMVTLTIVVAPLLPAGLGVPLFVAAMAAVVAIAHPAVKLTRRNR